MSTSSLSFLSSAEKITLWAYEAPQGTSVILSEVISRLAAVTLLSLAAALDIAIHTVLIFPTCLYALGKSLYKSEIDFVLPWQHLQRVRNAIAPLVLESAFGLIHPFAGLAMCEPADKHSILGMLSSNIFEKFDTPCSPVYSLSIVENMAATHQFVEKDGVKKEVFSPEHLQLIQDAKSYEKTLEGFQAQEFIFKITNITLFALSIINKEIEDCYPYEEIQKEIYIRLSGFLIPVLSVIDTAIALIMQTVLLATGIVQLISGRGPIYTEITFNPLMHIAFLIQNLLKLVSNLIGTLVWFVKPEWGFRVSLIPATLFFKAQMSLLMLETQLKMYFAKDNTRFAIPIAYGNGEHSALSFPFHSMHKTYLIVEKKGEAFNLYWVNRPNVSSKLGLDSEVALTQIRSMLDERYPFMDPEKVMNYPVKSKEPKFPESKIFHGMQRQGNYTNCVVSNLFGMLEALDKIKGEPNEITTLRYRTAREYLMKNYGFYQGDFSPYGKKENWYELEEIWDSIERRSAEHI